MSASAMAATTGTSPPGCPAAVKQRDVVGLEMCERCIEHFPARHDDDVEAANLLSPPEQFPGTAFRPVPFDGRPNLPRGRHAEPRRAGTIDHREQRHETAMHFRAGVIDPLELGASADSLWRRQALILDGGH